MLINKQNNINKVSRGETIFFPPMAVQ